MTRRLSERQEKILEFIGQEVDKKGYPPSVREIGDAVGLRSSSTVHGHLGRLEERGFIRRDPTKPRAIELLGRTSGHRSARGDYADDIVRVPIVGRVTAGEPILAVENVEDFFPIPKAMAHDDELFMLRVRGESMILAGILDGDHVLVRTQHTADNGDIVVALLGDEATVKRFFHEGTRLRLQPENPTMDPIYAHDAQVIGKVVGVFRRLQ